MLLPPLPLKLPNHRHIQSSSVGALLTHRAPILSSLYTTTRAIKTLVYDRLSLQQKDYDAIPAVSSSNASYDGPVEVVAASLPLGHAGHLKICLDATL